MTGDDTKLWVVLAEAVLKTSEDHAWMSRAFVEWVDRCLKESDMRCQLDSMRDKITARRDDVSPDFIAEFDSLASKYAELARVHAEKVTAMKIKTFDCIARMECKHEICGDALEKLKRSVA